MTVAAPPAVGLDYSPFRQHERPTFLYTPPTGSPRLLGLQPLDWELEEDAAILEAILGPGGRVRLYGSRAGNGAAAEMLARRGFRLTLGLWVGTDADENTAEIDAGISLLDRYPAQIERIIVGNETQGTGPGSTTSVSRDALIALLQQVKDRVAGRVPVAAAEVGYTWFPTGGSLNEPLIRIVDQIVVHVYGYFDRVRVEDSVDYVYQQLDRLRDALAAAGLDRPIVLGETGWPVGGRTLGDAQPGGPQQAQFVQQLLARAAARPEYQVFLFSAFSEPWKVFAEDQLPAEARFNVEDKWGVMTWQRTLQPDLSDILPTPPAPRPESSWFHVFTRGELSPGHDAGVDSSDHRYDWLTTESDAFVLRYPGSGCWGSVAIQRGVPTAQIPRPLYWDLSTYSHLVATVSGEQGGEPLEIAIKDYDDRDDGSETQLRVQGVAAQPRTVVIPLDAFDANRAVDRSRVYVGLAMSFVSHLPHTVRLQDAYYLPEGQTPPAGELTYEVVQRPNLGDADAFVDGCLGRWITVNVSTSSGQTDGVLGIDPDEPGALRFFAAPGQQWVSAYFHVGAPQSAPRTNFQDYSRFGELVFELRSETADDELWLGIKDADDAGIGGRVRISDVTTDWREHRISLGDFSQVNRARLSVVFELVVTDGGQHTCWFRNIRYE
jgi:exo-beta-1,3-glucanase (GH17 family)